MLLTALLSSASSLAVPSVAQKHSEFPPIGHDQLPSSDHHAHPSAAEEHPAHTSLLRYQQQQQQQQHGYRRADPLLGGPTEATDRESDDRLPDLFNLTLTAMRQYLRHQLNESRFGKAPRKRSHLVHVADDVDVEFYRRLKEFNNSQAALDGPMNVSTQHPGPSMNHSQSAVPDPEPADPGDGTGAVAPAVASSSSAAPVASSGGASATGSQRDYSVLMDDPRGYITASSSFPLRPGKSPPTAWNGNFVRHRGYIYGLVSFSVICALVLGLFGVFRCLRATTAARATEALTLPIQFIAEDLAPLNTDLNHLPVPMLSVQSPGCAGMERLGVPARGSIGSPPLRDERTRRLRVDSGVSGDSSTGYHHHHHSAIHGHHQQQPQQQQQQQQLPVPAQHHRSDLILSSTTSSNFKSNPPRKSCLFLNHHHHHHHNNHHNQQLSGGGSSGSSSINYKTHYSNTGGGGGSSYGSGSSTSGTSGVAVNSSLTSFPHCTHHVPLPDGEYGPDRDLQIRTPCQQSEIPRTYVKAPPNKTVRDVPVQYQSTGAISVGPGLALVSPGSLDGTASHLRSTSSVASGTSISAAAAAAIVGGYLHSSYGSGGLVAAASGTSVPPGTRLVDRVAATCQSSQSQKPDKLQKIGQILRLFPGNKTSKSSSPTSSSGAGSGISSSNSNNNNNHSVALASNNNFTTLHLGHLGCSGTTTTTTVVSNNNSVQSSVSAASNGLGGLGNNHINNNNNTISNRSSLVLGTGNSSIGSNSLGTTGSATVASGGRTLATGLVATGASIHNHNQHYRSSGPSAGLAVTPVVTGTTTFSTPLSTSSSSTSSSSSSSSSSACSSSSSPSGPGRTPGSGTDGNSTANPRGGSPPISVSPSPDPHAHYM